MKNVFEDAKEILKKNKIKIGLKAGDYYPDLWARDALISSLGMFFSEDEELKNIAKKSIENIVKFQKMNGQLPNKISSKYEVCFGEGGCVDSSLWYPIALLNYFRATDDKNFLSEHIKKIEKSISWLFCLDVNNDFLIETNEGSDWMDLLLRSGRVLYDNVLFYASLKACDKIRSVLGLNEKYEKIAEKVKNNINLFFWPEEKNLEKVRKKFGFTGIEKDFEIALRDGEKDYYFAEIGFRRYDPRCDVYANLLALIFEIPDEEKKKKILEHFKRIRVEDPYPVKVLFPPIYENDFFRPFYFRETELPYLQRPGNYHNGGIWPFVGGFYVCFNKSKKTLKKLAELNKFSNFCEWISLDCKTMGSKNQSWSAAMFILAYQVIKGKASIEI